MVTADEIAPELALSTLYQERLKEETELRKKDLKNLTIAERIKLRTYNQRFTIPLKDGKSIINVEMRTWTKKEIVMFDKAFPLMDEPSERGKQAFKAVCKFLGMMCIDKSLDCAFWESGTWGIQTFYELRNRLYDAMAQAVVDARDFRT